MVPAAHIATVFSPATRCTAPITWASEGRPLGSAPRNPAHAVLPGEPRGRVGPAEARGAEPAQPLQHDARIADDGQRAVLGGVVAGQVDRDQPAPGREQRAASRW